MSKDFCFTYINLHFFVDKNANFCLSTKRSTVSKRSFILLYVCTTFQTLNIANHCLHVWSPTIIFCIAAAGGQVAKEQWTDNNRLLWLHRAAAAHWAGWGAGYQEQGAVMYYVICIFWVLQLHVLPIRSMCVSCYLFTVPISLPKYFTKCNNENWETEDVFIGWGSNNA